MSKVVKVGLEIRNPEAFVQALRDVFGEAAVKVSSAKSVREAVEKASRGEGVARRAWGGATFRDAVAVVRAGTNYTVRLRKEAGGVLEVRGSIPYSDLALVAREEGVELVADHYTDPQLITAIRAAYVRRVAEEIARRQGRRVQDPVLKENGEIVVIIR